MQHLLFGQLFRKGALHQPRFPLPFSVACRVRPFRGLTPHAVTPGTVQGVSKPQICLPWQLRSIFMEEKVPGRLFLGCLVNLQQQLALTGWRKQLDQKPCCSHPRQDPLHTLLNCRRRLTPPHQLGPRIPHIRLYMPTMPSRSVSSLSILRAPTHTHHQTGGGETCRSLLVITHPGSTTNATNHAFSKCTFLTK
jgi:hypothetical protein